MRYLSNLECQQLAGYRLLFLYFENNTDFFVKRLSRRHTLEYAFVSPFSVLFENASLITIPFCQQRKIVFISINPAAKALSWVEFQRGEKLPSTKVKRKYNAANKLSARRHSAKNCVLRGRVWQTSRLWQRSALFYVS